MNNKPFSGLYETYTQTTPQSLKLIDAYLVFVLLTGIIQFIYVLLAGTFPYNAFLAGFICSVGSFVLAGNNSTTNASTACYSNILICCHF